MCIFFKLKKKDNKVAEDLEWQSMLKRVGMVDIGNGRYSTVEIESRLDSQVEMFKDQRIGLVLKSLNDCNKITVLELNMADKLNLLRDPCLITWEKYSTSHSVPNEFGKLGGRVFVKI